MSYQVYVKRRENKLRQEDVAKVLGINKQTYYLKERGKSVFTIPEAKLLARFYGCTLDELFGEGGGKNVS